jgi:hypothetical protein
MKKSCSNCDHWKNQNGPLLDAHVELQRVGACWKLQRAIVVLRELYTNSHNKVVADFVWPKEAIYTTESFCCNNHTEKILRLTRNK